MIEVLTGEDAKALFDELNIVKGEQAQLRKEFNELVVELKAERKKKA